jgi:hypothetical protein
MPAKTPLAVVKDKFGDKKKLVEALQALTGEALWVSRTNAAKGLAHVSNAKLLRLYATFTEVKEKFGTREKLIDAIVELEKRTKDAGYRQRLAAWPVPRLYDAYRSLQKREKKSSATAPQKKEKENEKSAKSAPAGKGGKGGKDVPKPKAAKKG